MRRRVNRGVLVWCVVALGALALATLRPPLPPSAATVLFLLEMFPQAPVKPLSALAPPPTRQVLVLDSVNGPLVGDLFVPGSRVVAPPRRPAVIIGTGVRLDREQDRAAIRHLATSLARLGYVALWPRLETIDGGAWQFERPETFVRAFQYLAERPDVDPARISLVGISLGASITLLAAADPAIASQVHAVVFLGGYFDLVDYIVAIADEQAIEDGRAIPWRPGDDTRRQARELVEAEGVPQLRPYLEPETALGGREALLAVLTPAGVARLQRFNPAEHVARVRAPVFILHDRHDEYVPFTESQKLAAALPPATPRSVLISSAFDHVQLGEDVSLETVAEYVALYQFLVSVFAALAR